jgi:hypothetical protein
MAEIIDSEYGTTVQEAAYFGSSKDFSFQLGIFDFAAEAVGHIARAVQSINVSYSMDMSPQVTVQLFDVNMAMLANNYFNIGRTYLYKTEKRSEYKIDENLKNVASENTNSQTSVEPQRPDNLGSDDTFGYTRLLYELASLSVGPGQGSSPSITLELRSRPIMQMKRDRNPGAIKETAPQVFVQQTALKYGLDFYTEKPSKGKVKINKASNDKRADSTWDVLSSLASEAKFSLFESDGVLFFASMRHLFGLWGPEQMDAYVFDEKTNSLVLRKMNSWYVEWPSVSRFSIDAQDVVEVGRVRQALTFARLLTPMQMPTFRRSDSDVYQVEGSMSLDRHNAMVLRPGMTIYVAGVPTFEDFYIITDVSFEHMSTNPVQVSFRKPEREDKYITDIPVGPFGDYVISDVGI